MLIQKQSVFMVTSSSQALYLNTSLFLPHQLVWEVKQTGILSMFWLLISLGIGSPTLLVSDTFYIHAWREAWGAERMQIPYMERIHGITRMNVPSMQHVLHK